MFGAIEIVGLSLAVFPIVISFLEHFEDGCDTLHDWVYFRREFTHLLNDLNREQIIFRQLVETMLRSIIDSEFELKEMLEDTQSNEWKRPDLALKMKQKLCGNGEYENCQSSLLSIHEHLVSMAKKLNTCGPLVCNPLPSFRDSTELSTETRAGRRIRDQKPQGPPASEKVPQAPVRSLQEEMARKGRQFGETNRSFGQAFW